MIHQRIDIRILLIGSFVAWCSGSVYSADTPKVSQHYRYGYALWKAGKYEESEPPLEAARILLKQRYELEYWIGTGGCRRNRIAKIERGWELLYSAARDMEMPVEHRLAFVAETQFCSKSYYKWHNYPELKLPRREIPPPSEWSIEG